MGDKTLEAVRKDIDIQKFTNEKDLENIDVLLDEIMKQQLESKESLLLILDDMVGNLKSKKIGMDDFMRKSSTSGSEAWRSVRGTGCCPLPCRV